MMTLSPYRLQIFVPDEELREAIKEIAHRQKTSVQKLVTRLLVEEAHKYPEYRHIAPPFGRDDS